MKNLRCSFYLFPLSSVRKNPERGGETPYFYKEAIVISLTAVKKTGTRGGEGNHHYVIKARHHLGESQAETPGRLRC